MGWALLGLFLILYAVLIVYITVKKPTAIWEMAKIKFFIKILGERGTVVFFYIFALIAGVVGIWLLAK